MDFEFAVWLLYEIINSPMTLENARRSPKYFTRKRKMTFENLLYFLITPAKECLRVREYRFWIALKKDGITMSPQALSNARGKFDHTPFETMTRTLVLKEYSGEFELPTFHGYSVFAIDGSGVVLPSSDKLREHFGTSGPSDTLATAGISCLFDVLNGWVVDARIGHYPLNERAEAEKHIEFLNELPIAEKSIVLFDRGYPSTEFLACMEHFKGKYLMRCQRSWLPEVEAARMGDSVISLKNGQKIRVYKFLLPSGEEERLVTNLFDMDADLFPELYFKRWGIESEYHLIKNKIQLENFTGYSVNAVMQDFWIAMTLANLVAITKKGADKTIAQRCEGKNNKYKQEANVSQLLATLKDEFIGAIILPTPELRQAAIDRIMQKVAAATVPIRPGRSFERKKHPKKRQYPMNSKSNI